MTAYIYAPVWDEVQRRWLSVAIPCDSDKTGLVLDRHQTEQEAWEDCAWMQASDEDERDAYAQAYGGVIF